MSAALVGGAAALATAVYSVTIRGLFGISALYHRRTWRTERGRAMMKRLDHSMIFLFIAGTYTPFAVLAMPRTPRWVLAWSGPGRWPASCSRRCGRTPRAGSACRSTSRSAGSRFRAPGHAGRGGVTALVLLLVGGLLYTVGAVFYAIH